MAFRDRFLTPRVARAITSPSGMLLAGAGASIGILAGAPIAVAAAIGAAAYAARVAAAVPRGPAKERIDPGLVGEPWRTYVREALDARARYADVLRTARAGPLRERLAAIGDRLDDGVTECWRIARRGHALEGGLRQLDIDSVRHQLAQVELDRSRGGGGSLESTAQALRSQLASYERLASVARDTRDRLRLLDARLDEAVARAVELSLAGDHGELGGLGSAVEELVGDMEALRQALEETGGGTPQIGVR